MQPVKYLDLSKDYAQRSWINDLKPTRRHPDDGAVEMLAYAILLAVTWSFVLLIWWLE